MQGPTWVGGYSGRTVCDHQLPVFGGKDVILKISSQATVVRQAHMACVDSRTDHLMSELGCNIEK